MKKWFNRKLAKTALFSAVYLGAAILSSQISFSTGSFPTLWLPGGLLLGVLLITQPAEWPVYLLGSLFGNIFYSTYTHQPFVMAANFYMSNCLEAYGAAWLVLRLNSLRHELSRAAWSAAHPNQAGLNLPSSPPAPSLSSPIDVLLVIVIAGPLCAALSAGVQAVMFIAINPSQSLWPAFRTAWTGHILGVIAVTPMVLSWRSFQLPALHQVKPERLIEIASLFLALLVWAYYIFYSNALFVGRSYIVMPLLVWAALRFGPRGVSLSGLLVSIAATWGLVWQIDSFAFVVATIAPNTDLLGGFLTINLVTCYFLTTSFEVGKQTAAELRQSQERYRRLIEAQGEGIGIVDLKETFTFSNHAGNQIFGIGPHETLTGHNLREFTQPGQFDVLIQRTQRRRSKKKASYEIEITRPDGQKRQLLVTATPEYDERGQLNGAFAIFRDITDRKLAEQALRESQASFQALFDHSPIANWEEDFSLIKQRLDDLREQGVSDFRQFFEANPSELWQCMRLMRVVKANQAAQQLYDSSHSAETLHGNSDLPHGPVEVMREEIIAISEGKLEFNYEGPNDLVDGKVRIHQVRWSVTPGSQDDYRRVIVSIIDVTDRKRSEERMRYLSTHDVLTGLYNRNFFEAEMERLQNGRQYPINLMVVDVNGMKSTNDTFGHAAGDELLKRTAQVLQLAFRKEDIIARIGGDEFVVMFTGTMADKDALRRVRECLEEHNMVAEGQPLSLAIGVANGERGSQLVEVLKKADQQMYREKNRIKRNRVE